MKRTQGHGGDQQVESEKARNDRDVP